MKVGKLFQALFVYIEVLILTSILGMLSLVFVEMIFAPKGSFLNLGLWFVSIVYLSFLVFYSAPVFVAVFCLAFSKKVWTNQKLKIIGLFTGISGNFIYYFVLDYLSIGYNTIDDYVPQFFLHTALVSLMIMFYYVTIFPGKLRNNTIQT